MLPARFVGSIAGVADLVTVVRPDLLRDPAGELATAREGGEVIVAEAAQVLPRALARARDRPVEGVVTWTEPLLQACAGLAQRLGLPGHSASVAQAVRLKHLQRLALDRGGVPVPAYHRIRAEADLEPALRRVSLPAVLKPCVGFSSICVFRIDRPDELRDAYREAARLVALDPRLETAGRGFLLEELLVGESWHGDVRFGDYVSVETLVARGRIHHLTVVDKYPLAPPFRETGDLMPSLLPPVARQRVLDAATDALRALGVTDSATHTELKLTPAGPRVIEVNGRVGGGVPELMEEAARYDVVRELAKVALGLEPELPSFRRYASWIQPQTPAADVRVVELGRVGPLRRLASVRSAAQSLAPGDVPDWRRGRGRIVDLLAAADDPEELVALRTDVESMLAPVYEPVSEPAAVA